MRGFVRPEEWIGIAGNAGVRHTAAEVARGLGVSVRAVTTWIKRGWLRASPTTTGHYRIKRRAVRRVLLEYPSVARQVADARIRAINRKRYGAAP